MRLGVGAGTSMLKTAQASIGSPTIPMTRPTGIEPLLRREGVFEVSGVYPVLEGLPAELAGKFVGNSRSLVYHGRIAPESSGCRPRAEFPSPRRIRRRGQGI